MMVSVLFTSCVSDFFVKSSLVYTSLSFNEIMDSLFVVPLHFFFFGSGDQTYNLALAIFLAPHYTFVYFQKGAFYTWVLFFVVVFVCLSFACYLLSTSRAKAVFCVPSIESSTVSRCLIGLW